MALGFLQSFDDIVTVRSAGTEPAKHINQRAVMAMKEAGIDISYHTPKHVDQFLGEDWDYVITVCDHANETCPVFVGKVKHRLHMGFEDPSKTEGSDEYIMSEFRRVRDQIKNEFYNFYVRNIKPL